MLSIVFLIAASVLILPQYRRHIHLVLLGTATAASVVFVIAPGLGRQILVTTRFIDSPSAAGSNRARIDAMSQGWHDFLESPIYGIGLHVLFQAHNGYIQSLASGGLILLIGILALQFGALWESFRLMRTEAMATALAATMLTRIGYEAIEGALVHYAALVPIALIAALLAQQRQAEAGAGSVTEEAACCRAAPGAAATRLRATILRAGARGSAGDRSRSPTLSPSTARPVPTNGRSGRQAAALAAQLVRPSRPRSVTREPQAATSRRAATPPRQTDRARTDRTSSAALGPVR